MAGSSFLVSSDLTQDLFLKILKELGGSKTPHAIMDYTISLGSDHVWLSPVPDIKSNNNYPDEYISEWERALNAKVQFGLELAFNRNGRAFNLLLFIAQYFMERSNVLLDDPSGNLIDLSELEKDVIENPLGIILVDNQLVQSR